MAKQSIKSIKETVLRQIRPKAGGIREKAVGMVARINREIEKGNHNAVAVPGGSVAKDTFLENDHDVDIFVKFDLSYKDKDISKMLARILKPLGPVVVHGSRDYFQLKDGLHYEIVPVLDIRKASQAVNVTDMSPMHVQWVRKHIRKNTWIADEIRLAKQFTKAAKCYGAESFIGGFSGHVLDILIIHFGSFERFLKGLIKLRPGAVIDSTNHHKGKAKRNLNPAKLQSPIIVIDPILPDRNAAAALTKERFDRLGIWTKAFLKFPSEEAFTIRSITADELAGTAKDEQLIMLESRPKKGKIDIIGGKLLKAHDHIRRQLIEHGFTVIEADWQWDKGGKALFWYILPKRPLTREHVWAGPQLTQKQHVKQFKRKHKKTKERGGRIYAKVNRRYVDAGKLVDSLMASGYVKERVAGIKKI